MTVIPMSKQTGTLIKTSMMIHEEYFRDIFFLLFLFLQLQEEYVF